MKQVKGKVVLQGSMPEGAMVTVLAPDDPTFTLSPDDEAALLASISEADRGEIVDGEVVLKKLGGKD